VNASRSFVPCACCAALLYAWAAAASARAQQPAAPEPGAAAPDFSSLGLTDALRLAREHQPTLRQARAATDATRARSGQARAPLFPQLEATASYQKTTSNCTTRPGMTPCGLTGAADPDFDLFDYFNFGITARQLVWDFGQTYKRADAAEMNERAQEQSEHATLYDVEQNVRVAFFEARAAKALVAVAQETLANFDEHVRQIEGFVRAGTRADIDLAQARTERANARVDLINAENGYVAGKARLNRAIGIERNTAYEVADEGLAPIAGEDGALAELQRRALANRPELRALERQVQSQELTRSAIRGGYFPSLSIFTGATEAGVQLDDLTWNWNAGATLTWQLFEGGITSAQVDEASANLVGLRAEFDGLRQQVRLEVEEAQLEVRAAKAVIGAAEEAETSAREQLRLAEGRYKAGVGSGLELEDAQLALQSAAAQRVRADYALASARAHLQRALGE
jgi:outer membrane protein